MVFEKNERVGGKLNLMQADGYTFDTGPSLFTMPWILADLFTAAGRDMHAYLDLVQIEPTCRYWWPDGTQFNAWQRLPQLVQEVARLNPTDVEGLFRFLAHSAHIYNIVADAFLLHPFDGIRDLLTPELLRHGMHIDAFRNIDTAVRSFFQNPYLQQVFNRYATYNGSSPYLSPATFNVIAYIEFAEGGWYIRGGMYELARALLRLTDELAIDIHTGTEVSNVLVERGRAYGIRTSDGRSFTADTVVVNADPRYAYDTLLSGQERTAARLRRLEPSCSGFILMLGVNHRYEQLSHHTIFFSQDYQQEFDYIFNKKDVYEDPTVYINITSKYKPDDAPEGAENWFTMINVPNNSGQDWDEIIERSRNNILKKMSRMLDTDVASLIACESLLDPRLIEQKTSSSMGALYGNSSNNKYAAFLRHANFSRKYKNLYFCGGSVHPGGGIPLSLLSAKIAADQVPDI